MTKKILFQIVLGIALLCPAGRLCAQNHVHQNPNAQATEPQRSKPSFFQKTKAFFGFGEEDEKKNSQPNNAQNGNAAHVHNQQQQNIPAAPVVHQPRQPVQQRQPSANYSLTYEQPVSQNVVQVQPTPTRPQPAAQRSANNVPTNNTSTNTGTGNNGKSTFDNLARLRGSVFEQEQNPAIGSNRSESGMVANEVPVNPKPAGVPTLAMADAYRTNETAKPAYEKPFVVESVQTIAPEEQPEDVTVDWPIARPTTPEIVRPAIPNSTHSPRIEEILDELDEDDDTAIVGTMPPLIENKASDILPRMVTPIANDSGSNEGSSELVRRENALTEIPIAPPSNDGSFLKTDETKITRKSPVIEVETIGPKKIIVGQDATYHIRLNNRGVIEAEQVVLNIDLPVWTDVQGAEASSGSTGVRAEKGEQSVFHWNIEKLAPQGTETLVLRLVPRERKSFDLRMEYDFRRETAMTKVEVQEAKIDMSLEGPNELVWGTEQVYRLHVKNTGNGDAEDVKLTLLPPGGNPAGAAMHTMGMIRVGEEKKLHIRAQAKQKDKLDINIVANGAHGLKAEISRQVGILRPSLAITVDTSEMQFVGNKLEYRLKVKNSGTAPARDVLLTANIPLGTKYLSCTKDGRTALSDNQVLWTVASIAPEGTFECTLVCETQKDGECKLEASVSEETGMSAEAVAITKVESIANLAMKLDVPKGPIEIGTDSLYSFTVINTGTKAAENIDMFAAFVEELEPLKVEKGTGSITNDGVVLFDRISVLNPGQSHTFKVYAKAIAGGNHKVRVEMVCKSIGTNLVHEGTAMFYSKQQLNNGIKSAQGTTYDPPLVSHNPSKTTVPAIVVPEVSPETETEVEVPVFNEIEVEIPELPSPLISE